MMEKRASEHKVSLHSDSFKRCKKCGAVENEFYYDREQPDQINTNTAMYEDYDWGMDFTGFEENGIEYTGYENMGMDYPGFEDMRVADGYMASGDMNAPGMYPDQMSVGQMSMPHMEMNQMSIPYMKMPQMGMNQMNMDNMYYGMADMNDPYMGLNMNPENQMVPEMEYQQVDQMFQIIGQMLEEIINREARIISLIEELKETQR